MKTPIPPWLRTLDRDELLELAKDVIEALEDVANGKQPLAHVRAVVHEWEESAWALASPDVQAAFDAAPNATGAWDALRALAEKSGVSTKTMISKLEAHRQGGWPNV